MNPKRGKITVHLGPVEAEAVLSAISSLEVSQEGEEIDARTRRTLDAAGRVGERIIRAQNEKGWLR